ncbi:MAG TPA: tetratricopeptide repeat protein [Candidatus Deferrimicrobiaceae bacterium]
MTGGPVRGAAGSPLPALLFALLLAVSACARVPKIIVLEDPLSADEHVTLGVAYEREGKLDLAAREYEAALKKDNAFFQARVNLGNVRLAQMRYDAAREEYLEALALRPSDPEATNNLAWAAILSGKEREDALRRMESVLADPVRRSPPLLDTLGVLLDGFSRPVEAERAFAEAEQLCGAGDPACTDAVTKEIREHREALRKRFPVPSGEAPLVR